MKTNYKETVPSAEELLRKIQDLEQRHICIKQEIFKLTKTRSKPNHRRSNSASLHRAISGAHERGVATFPHIDKLENMKLTETQYLNIMESIGQAVHVYDCQLRIICWNQAAEDLYGYTFAEAYGKNPTDLLVDPKQASYSNYLLKRTVNGESWSGGFPVKNKKGEKFEVIGTNTPLRDQNTRLLGAVCISTATRHYQVIKPGKIAYTRLGLDSLQPSIASKISNLALKVKLKMKKDDVIAADTLEIISPRGDIAPSPFGVFFSVEMDQNFTEKCTTETSGWLSYSHINSTSSNNAIVKVEMDTDNLDYEILWEDLITREKIGQGSCGTVYHALWYGSNVAVKLFACQDYSDDVILSFKQEVSLMKRLRHPNILLFMGAVTSPQHLCIVMEFLPRGSLFRILQRNKTRLDWRHRLHMAMDIARGMNYLHHCNPPIVHRDLKSSNLLVDKNWNVKVGDFGLSRIKHQTYLKTKSGKGTPQWMAPEVLRNEHADEKSDVYSYGVVLWELTTEKIPWDNLNLMQIIEAVGFMNQRLEIPEDADPQWASLIESCWCSEPQSRPTFQEILYKLKDLQKTFAVERRR